jgi:release factor glutamine methyltransferase
MGVDGTVTWGELLAETEARLAAVDGDAARRHARWLCEEASGREGAQLDAHLGDPATVRGVAHLDSMVARRLEGEPIQYVLGHWPFRTLDLAVDPRVLIPRPETEQVVEVALAEVDRAGVEDTVVVDMGTGSGAIGLSIAVERRRSTVWMTDVDPRAVAVARANLAGIGRAATRVTIGEGSWFEALPSELHNGIHVLVSNPPYVAEHDDVDAVVGEWEPAGALWARDDGLEHVAHLLAGARDWLVPGGSIVVEIGAAQGSRARELASAAGYVEVDVLPDLSGRDRVLRARRPAGSR